jgi:urocanate hydratase
MLYWDVNNGIARRSWAVTLELLVQSKKAMEQNPQLKVTVPTIATDEIIKPNSGRILYFLSM